MPRALKTCSTAGCPELVATGRCDRHRAEAEARRGTAAQRGYDRRHRRFRAAVLARDPICVMPDCWAPAAHADHHPLSLRDLQAAGLDPYDPERGRGLCAVHHSRETARHQPGGWAVR